MTLPGPQLQLSRNAIGPQLAALPATATVDARNVDAAGVEAATHVHVRQPRASGAHVGTSSLRKHAHGVAAAHDAAAVVARTVVAAGARVDAAAVGAAPHAHDTGQPRASVVHSIGAPAGHEHAGIAPHRAVVVAMARVVATTAVVAADAVFARGVVAAATVVARVVLAAKVVAARVVGGDG